MDKTEQLVETAKFTARLIEIVHTIHNLFDKRCKISNGCLTPHFIFKEDNKRWYGYTVLNRIAFNVTQLKKSEIELGHNKFLGKFIFVIVHELYHLYQLKTTGSRAMIESQAIAKANIFIKENELEIKRIYIRAEFPEFNYEQALKDSKGYNYRTYDDTELELRKYFKDILNLPYDAYIKMGEPADLMYDKAYNLYLIKEKLK